MQWRALHTLGEEQPKARLSHPAVQCRMPGVHNSGAQGRHICMPLWSNDQVRYIVQALYIWMWGGHPHWIDLWTERANARLACPVAWPKKPHMAPSQLWSHPIYGIWLQHPGVVAVLRGRHSEGPHSNFVPFCGFAFCWSGCSSWTYNRGLVTTICQPM